MTWLLPDGLGLVVFGSANHQPTMNIAMTAEGSESVRLRHDYNMQSVSDTVTIHVVDLAITEAPELAVGLPALGPGHFTVHAMGTPSPGFYVWTIRDQHIVEFPGGLDPENHAAPQFQPLRQGQPESTSPTHLWE